MSNPTGTTYLTENSGYAWTDGDVYEILQGDAQEGAGTGASFNGLGVDNQPHQLLLNKAKLLRVNQINDEANIATLQAFMGQFVSTLNPGGGSIIKIGGTDTIRGALQLIIQCGYYSLSDLAIPQDTEFAVSWPQVFPNAVLFPPLAVNVYAQTGGRNTAASVVSWTTSGGVFVLDVPNATTGSFSGSERSNGFGWLAVGF